MAKSSAYNDTGAPTYTTVGTPREIEILKLLSRYDLLPSSFIYHALSKRQSIRDYLSDLRKGHYIGLPDLPRDEKLAYIPRNSHYVYELKPRGRMLLAKHGSIVTQGGNDHYKHRLLRSQIEYLLDIAPLHVDGVADILSDRRCPQTTRNAPYPFRIGAKPALEPDITRGFGDGDSVIFLHIEVDRGTEPVLSQNIRQSLKSKVEHYTKYLEGKTYQEHFGFSVAPSILFMTTRTDTSGLISLFPTKGKLADRFYVVTIPEKPLPTTNLIVPWQGASGTLNLMEKFGGHTEETGASEPARIGD